MGRRSDAKERILESAIELIHGRSYADVGVKDLCDHAGVKKGSFYHFFDSKKALILEALDRHYQAFRKHLQQKVFQSQQRPLDRFESLNMSLYRGHKKCKEKNGEVWGCLLGNLTLEMSTRDKEIQEALMKHLSDLQTMIGKTIEDAIEQGDLPAVDVSLASEAVLAHYQGLQLLAKLRNDPEVLMRHRLDIRIIVEGIAQGQRESRDQLN